MNIPADHSEQSREFDEIQKPSQKQSTEELEQELKVWQENSYRAKLKEKIRTEKKKFRKLESLNSSTRTNRDFSTQGRQNSYLNPQNQVSKTQNPPVSQLTSRKPLNYIRPLFKQGGSSVRENFEQRVCSPIYCQLYPGDNRYSVTLTTYTFGGTPRTATSQLHHLMQRNNELVSQVGYIKRDTDQLNLKLQHSEKIADDYNIHLD